MANSEEYHWADRAADQIIKLKGDKKKYVVAAGITPSGTIHVGNFREVITQELIKRALEKKGKKVRFIYSWDDNDVFRRVPKNLPRQDELQKELRKPIFDVLDPFGCHNSYSEHFEKEMEEDLPVMGVFPEFIYQHRIYQACEYSEGIKTALEKTEKIKEILNKHRKEPLADDWLPIFVFCQRCGKDTIEELRWLGGYEISYMCECGHKEKFDFRKKGTVTLRWRVDWPMRWDHYKEDFESAGKDHFAAGGSVETGRAIQKEVYGTEPPFGFPYEWIAIKGKGEFASSLGKVITLRQMLEIYEPELIRYLFASTRPNVCFNISFDLDVLKLYDDFDKCERIYFGKEEASEKEKSKQSRIYEFSFVDKCPKSLPFQPGFRHLTTILQIKGMDADAAIKYFEKQLKNKFDRERLEVRMQCAKNWIEKFAPEEFKWSVQAEPKVKLNPQEKKIIQIIIKKLKEKEWEAVDLHNEFYETCKAGDFPVRDFFKLMYKILINKEKGPRLAAFIIEIGKDRVIELLDKAQSS